MKRVIVIVVILMSQLMVVPSAFGIPQGSGTAADPWRVASLDDLHWLSQKPEVWDDCFRQTGDIDATATRYWNHGAGFSPIGQDEDHSFSGSYDGQGFRITHLYMDRPATYTGLFGVIRNARLSDVHLMSAEIYGTGNSGGLAGAVVDSRIGLCEVSGTVEGAESTGGITGMVSGGSVLDGCTVQADLKGHGEITGGVAGQVRGSVLKQCSLTGQITTDFSLSQNLGGIAGLADCSKITHCQARGTLLSLNSYTNQVGGAVGELTDGSLLEYASFQGNIHKPHLVVSMYTGGLVGMTDGSRIRRSFCTGNLDSRGCCAGLTSINTNQSLIEDCYSRMNVTGRCVAGLVRWNENSTITRCYAAGELTGSESAFGLIHTLISGEVVSSFWDMELSGQTASNGGSGATTAELGSRMFLTLQEPAWDFAGEWNYDQSPEDIWGFNYALNSTYPVLTFQPVWPGEAPAGSGTAPDPYRMETLAHLRWLSVHHEAWSDHFVQVSDIDASETGEWNNGFGMAGIGDEYNGPFTGEYHGRLHRISGMCMNHGRTSESGLFGWVSGGAIDSLILTDVDIRGAWFAGALAGHIDNHTRIRDCSVSGTVSGGSDMGGLVGAVYDSDLSRCHADCRVINGFFAGGLAGRLQWGQLECCSSMGSLENGDHTGGLVADAIHATLTDCWSRSTVHARGGAGGLIDMMSGGTLANNCYAAGRVESRLGYSGGLVSLRRDSCQVENCFWDLEVSGQAESDGGTGKTTLAMQLLATYTDLATEGLDYPWDFVNDPGDDTGSRDIWIIPADMFNGYPVLNPQPEFDAANSDRAFPLQPPKILQLQGAYPNPFNEAARIEYELARPSVVRLQLFDILGREAAAPVKQWQKGGMQRLCLNGHGLSSGIYIYRLSADGQSATGRIMLVK